MLPALDDEDVERLLAYVEGIEDLGTRPPGLIKAKGPKPSRTLRPGF